MNMSAFVSKFSVYDVIMNFQKQYFNSEIEM